MVCRVRWGRLSRTLIADGVGTYRNVSSVSLGQETDRHQMVARSLRWRQLLCLRCETVPAGACGSDELSRGTLNWKLRSTQGVVAAGKEGRTTPLEAARLKVGYPLILTV